MADNRLPLFKDAGKFYVYLYRDPRPRKKLAPIYVGKGTAKNKRADTHWSAVKHYNAFFGRLLTKIRALKLEPVIEIVAWYDDEKSAHDCEKRLIARFGRRDSGSGTLCNLTDGGDGNSGAVFSEERKKNISLALTGLKRSEAYRAKKSEMMKLRMSDAANRAAVAAATRRVMADPKARERISLTLKARGVTPEQLQNLKKAWAAKTGLKVPEEQKARAKATFQANYVFKKRGKMSAETIALRQATRAANRAAQGSDKY